MAWKELGDMNAERRTLAAIALAALAVVPLVSGAASASQGAEWTSAGGNRQNTRYQQSEHTLTVKNVSGLVPRWVLETGGDVSATPAVDADTVYVPDWAGSLYAVDMLTGAIKWVASIPDASGVLLDVARVTPAVTGDKVIVGTQGTPGSVLTPGGGPGAGCSRSTSSQVSSSGTPWRSHTGRHHHPVTHRVRQASVRRRVLTGRAGCRSRARL